MSESDDIDFALPFWGFGAGGAEKIKKITYILQA